MGFNKLFFTALLAPATALQCKGVSTRVVSTSSHSSGSANDNKLANELTIGKGEDAKVCWPFKYTEYPIYLNEKEIRKARYSELLSLKNDFAGSDLDQASTYFPAKSKEGKSLFSYYRWFNNRSTKFVQDRQAELQLWLNKVVELDPFLQDPHLQNFIGITNVNNLVRRAQTEQPKQDLDEKVECTEEEEEDKEEDEEQEEDKEAQEAHEDKKAQEDKEAQILAKTVENARQDTNRWKTYAKKRQLIALNRHKAAETWLQEQNQALHEPPLTQSEEATQNEATTQDNKSMHEPAAEESLNSMCSSMESEVESEDGTQIEATTHDDDERGAAEEGKPKSFFSAASACLFKKKRTYLDGDLPGPSEITSVKVRTQMRETVKSGNMPRIRGTIYKVIFNTAKGAYRRLMKFADLKAYKKRVETQRIEKMRNETKFRDIRLQNNLQSVQYFFDHIVKTFSAPSDESQGKCFRSFFFAFNNLHEVLQRKK